ncbi:MAG TPA: hypothetical protein VF718_08245 [Allosphingosinicella sp.]|jgi:hypothetical protein
MLYGDSLNIAVSFLAFGCAFLFAFRLGDRSRYAIAAALLVALSGQTLHVLESDISTGIPWLVDAAIIVAVLLGCLGAAKHVRNAFAGTAESEDRT